MPYNVWHIAEERWQHIASFKTRAEAEALLTDGCEIRKVGDVLEDHGTKLMQLKPSMVWRCAMDDLERLAHNKAVTAVDGDYKQYAFHRRHVAKAMTANDIIRAAIEQPGLGRASGKRDTRLLYDDIDLLRAALQ